MQSKQIHILSDYIMRQMIIRYSYYFEVCQKYSAESSIFKHLFGGWECDQMSVFDILNETNSLPTATYPVNKVHASLYHLENTHLKSLSWINLRNFPLKFISNNMTHCYK